MPNRTKLKRTKPHRTEQNRTEQNATEQNKNPTEPEQDGTEQRKHTGGAGAAAAYKTSKKGVPNVETTNTGEESIDTDIDTLYDTDTRYRSRREKTVR